MADPLKEFRRLVLRTGAEGSGATRAVRRHPMVAGAVATAAVAAGAASIALRRVLSDSSSGSTPGLLAQTTALSVWDAAKGSVIARVRDAGDAADLAVVERAAREAVRDAAAAGADITAAALGAVEGALAVPHLLRTSPHGAASAAADAAVAAAREVGEPAAARVEEALRARFPAELHRAG